MKKIFFLVFILLITKLTKSQNVPHSFNVYSDVVVSTIYRSPLLGLTGELNVPMDNTKLDIVLRPSVWIDPSFNNEHFVVIQMGLNKNINKKTIVGCYFMNQQSFIPRPKYKSQLQARNEGYNSPFSLFLIAKPFHNEKIQIKSEYNYFIRYNDRFKNSTMNKSSFMLTFSYQLKKFNPK